MIELVFIIMLSTGPAEVPLDFEFKNMAGCHVSVHYAFHKLSHEKFDEVVDNQTFTGIMWECRSNKPGPFAVP